MLRAMAMLVLLVFAAAASADEDPEFAAALAKCPGAAKFVELHGNPSEAKSKVDRNAGRPGDPALRQRLLDMQKADQEVRSKQFAEMTQADIKKWMQVDTANLPQIKRIVAEHDGLPDAAEVGADGVAAAWILVQHADTDPAFQTDVLGKISPLVKSGQVTSHEYALMTDRVLVNQGKPQRYGSQIEARDGKWVPKPMEAPEQVDQRRASVGEMPLADYMCVGEQLFGPPPVNFGGKPEK